jgi:predicted metalloprotease
MQEACEDPNGNDTADDMSYAYCPADDNVSIGQQLAWELYSEAGDVAPAIGIAHEFGHNVQTHVGVPVPRSDAQTLVHENQADCVAGAWPRDPDRRRAGDSRVQLLTRTTRSSRREHVSLSVPARAGPVRR